MRLFTLKPGTDIEDQPPYGQTDAHFGIGLTPEDIDVLYETGLKCDLGNNRVAAMAFAPAQDLAIVYRLVECDNRPETFGMPLNLRHVNHMINGGFLVGSFFAGWD